MSSSQQCLHEISSIIPKWNLNVLRERYPEHRPPLSSEVVDSWGITNPQLYEYLTEFSDTIYIDNYARSRTINPIKSHSNTIICLVNFVDSITYLDLSSGKVYNSTWMEKFEYDKTSVVDSYSDYSSSDDSSSDDSEADDCVPWLSSKSDYYKSISSNSFEEFIMEQFKEPFQNGICPCNKCKNRCYALNYSVLRAMAGIPGLNYSV